MGKDMTNDKTAVVARLRAAAAERARQAEADGREQGRRWAEECADPVQLRRLQAADDQTPSPWADHLKAVATPGGENLPVALYHLIEPGAADVREVDWFWQDVLDEDVRRLTEPGFAAGFVLGALEVWQGVKADV